jgi:hypothetical protein
MRRNRAAVHELKGIAEPREPDARLVVDNLIDQLAGNQHLRRRTISAF